MANSVNLQKKIFFVVTGASRGIGHTMAIECSKKMLPGSVVVLLARSVTGLNNTKSQILIANPDITVNLYSIDLTRPSNEELTQCLTNSLQNKQVEDFELAFIIHNVGSLGDISKHAKDLSDLEIWRDYYDINVFGVALLNSVFMKIFQTNKKFICNITSKSSMASFKSFALYCSGKAAREMYFRVLALEESDVLVLNYAPGPVDTEMTNYAQASSVASEVRDMFKGLRDTKTILTTFDTTSKFLQVIEKGTYASGDHIDYYD